MCENGGDILEIGFGGGVTADMIQNYNIKTHTIIERDDYFFEKLWEWSVDKPNVKVIHGDWINDIPKNKKYDGIFFDLWNDSEDYNRQKKVMGPIRRPHQTRDCFLMCYRKQLLIKVYI